MTKIFNALKWQTLLLVLSTLFTFSCNSNSSSSKGSKETLPEMKTYSYIEVIFEDDITGRPVMKEKEPIEIHQTADSLAYIEAYRKFCIFKEAVKKTNQDLGSQGVTTEVKEFKLLNESGINIVPTIKFTTKELQEKEIRDQLSKVLDNSDSNSGSSLTLETKHIEIDSLKVSQLSPNFIITKDEFSNENLCWYTPKSAPKYVNQNGIYCYFQTINGKASNLRLKVQYAASEWLFFQYVKFSIDDKAYSYYPSKVETDSGNGGIWEWFDSSLTDSDKELIYALANAKVAKIKFEGRQYSKVKDISAKQIAAIKQTLELYNALGGSF